MKHNFFIVTVLRQRLQRKARTMRFGMGGLEAESVCAAQIISTTNLL